MNWSYFFPKSIHLPNIKARELLRYLGPGILVTVGFIDPGNWAANIAAGSGYGYTLLWMVSLSTIMLIILQHNVAHLGIATGYCLSEAATTYLPCWLSRLLLSSAMAAAVATAVAEILGIAIALQILFAIPLTTGSIFAALLAGFFLWTNAYQRLEKWIIGFVSIIGFSFLVQLNMAPIDWPTALRSWIVPEIPAGSLPIIMSVLGAVVMPHNLFLHSEIIQSRQWNLEDDSLIQRQLRYEFVDTLFSMLIGWAINSAIILVAAATFFQAGLEVTTMEQAEAMLRPLLGPAAAVIFAVALLFSGFSSTTTAGMAGGSIFAGIFREPYDIHDVHSRWGVAITYGLATATIFLISDAFRGLVFSQVILSMQLPFTVFMQIYLTSSPKVMGKYANNSQLKITLFTIAAIITLLNLWLLADFVTG